VDQIQNNRTTPIEQITTLPLPWQGALRFIKSLLAEKLFNN